MKKYTDIKDFFNHHLKDLKIDKKLIKQIKTFRFNWSTKSDEYIEFLGSNLLGVHQIRFSILDDDTLMKEVLGLEDYKEMQEDIFNVKDMSRSYKVASNIIYQTLMYIGHVILKDKKLSKDDKYTGVREVCLIMNYKMFSSRYARYFPYSVPEHIATTVYNKLNNKFLIKRLDSWQDVFDYRVDICLDKKEPDNHKLIKFDTLSSIRLISSIHTKINANFKEIAAILYEVLDSDEIIKEESSTFVGGENDLKQVVEKTTGTLSYITNLKTIAQQPNDFIDLETLNIVHTLFKNVNAEDILKILRHMSDSDVVDNKTVTDLVESILSISFNYLQRNNINIENREEIPKALIAVRFYFSSSKVENKEMDKIKKFLYKEVKKATGRNTKWYLITVTLSYILYVFLRSLKK